MAHELQGRRIAVLATDGVEEVELLQSRWAVEEACARTQLLSLQPGKIQAVNDNINPADHVVVDRPVSEASAEEFDALLIPGGTVSPDRLRQDEAAVAFVRAFFEQGKPVAVICHGPWVLVEAGVVQGRRLTSFRSLEADVRNAGGEWVDEAVVTDGGLVTSRSPDDLDAFCRKIVEEFAEGKHQEQVRSA